MQGQLYRIHLHDNRSEWEGPKGERQKAIVERDVYLEVYLPDSTPLIPQTFVRSNSKYNSTDVEMSHSGRVTTKCVRLESVDFKINDTGYSGEQQDYFQSLSRKALSNPQALEKLNAMIVNNQTVKQKMTVNYVIVLRIAKDEMGDWDWATEYSAADVSTERIELSVFKPEYVGEEQRGPMGAMFNVANPIMGEVNHVENVQETAQKKRSARELWAEKLECITSTDLVAERKDKSEDFHWREAGTGEWRSSVINLDHDVFGADDYYDDKDNTPERDWDWAFYSALKDNEEYREQVILMASLLMVCPKGKKVFIVCDHNPGKDGKKHNQGCGHNRNKCHTKFIAGLVLNICNNSSGKNPYNPDAKEYAECWEVDPKDIQ